MESPHEFIFIDEAGFNLTKRRSRGRNIIGQHAIVEVPGEHGGNVTLCAAIMGFSMHMQPWSRTILNIKLYSLSLHIPKPGKREQSYQYRHFSCQSLYIC